MCAESAAKGDVADTLARISAGADVERPDGARMMMNALHRAARAGQEGAVRALLESGAVVEARDADGMTALFHAAKGDSKACCRVLVRDYKCDVEARDKNGWTALTHALFFGKKDTTSYVYSARVYASVVRAGAKDPQTDTYGPLPPLLRPYSRPRYYYVLPPTNPPPAPPEGTFCLSGLRSTRATAKASASSSVLGGRLSAAPSTSSSGRSSRRRERCCRRTVSRTSGGRSCDRALSSPQESRACPPFFVPSC